VFQQGGIRVAAQTPRKRGSAAPAVRKHVMVSVRLDVGTNARLSAAAALAGIDKSAFRARAIAEALAGIVVFARRNRDGHGAPSDEVDRAVPA
jgi:hypothetical protein